MKSAYELAMERLNKTAPTVTLTADQKKDLAELDSIYAAKVAERELAIQDQINAAKGQGDFEKVDELQKQLQADRRNLQSDLEEKKDKIRAAKKR